MSTIEEVPKYIDLAKQIHDNRLRAIYFDPRDPAAQVEFTNDLAHELIKFTKFSAEHGDSEEFKDLNDEEQSNLQWFFIATSNPETRAFIFSKASLEKQNEFKDERDGWIKWLRKKFEDSHRVAIEMTNREMQRVRPEGDESCADKWLFKIKLKSWSYSIRPNQLTQWNETVETIKLFSTNDKNERIIQFTMPKSVPMKAVWPAGMINCVVFVTSLDIATMGSSGSICPRSSHDFMTASSMLKRTERWISTAHPTQDRMALPGPQARAAAKRHGHHLRFRRKFRREPVCRLQAIPQREKSLRVGWLFGLKTHIGVDSKEGQIHSVATSAANVSDEHTARNPMPGLKTMYEL